MNQFQLRWNAAVCVLIILIFYIYSPAIDFEFVWDDKTYLIGTAYHLNPDYVIDALTKPFLTSNNYYRPLVALWLYFEADLTAANPKIMHLTNLIVHCINIFIFSIILKELLNRFNSRYKIFPLIIITTFFGLHPTTIESVAWVSGRFDLALTLFLLLALLCDLKINNKILKSISVGFCFFLAALCKEMAIGFALAIPFWHIIIHSPHISWNKQTFYIFIRSSEFKTYLSITLFGLLYLCIRYLSLGYLYVSGDTTYEESVFGRILLVAKSIGLYFKMLIFPFISLSPVHYQPRPIPTNDITGWLTLIVIVSVLSISLFKKRLRGVVLVFLVFIASLFPVLNIIPMTINSSIIHNRFLLFPLALTLLVSCVLLLNLNSKQAITRKFTKTIIIFFLAITFFSGFTTYKTIPLWRNDISLWSWAAKSNPKSAYAQAGYAASLANNMQLDSALLIINQTLISNKKADYLMIKGNILSLMGRYSDAEQLYLESLDYPVSSIAYAATLERIASVQLAQDKLQDIEYLLDRSLKISPYAHGTHFRYYTYNLKSNNNQAALNSINLAIRFVSDKGPRDYYIQLKNELIRDRF